MSLPTGIFIYLFSVEDLGFGMHWVKGDDGVTKPLRRGTVALHNAVHAQGFVSSEPRPPAPASALIPILLITPRLGAMGNNGRGLAVPLSRCLPQPHQIMLQLTQTPLKVQFYLREAEPRGENLAEVWKRLRIGAPERTLRT